MTAKDTNRVGSDNFVSRSVEETKIITEHDARSRRIVRHARNIVSSMRRRDLLTKIYFSDDWLCNLLRWLVDGGYVDLIGDAEHEAIVLTPCRDHFAGGTP